MGPTPPVLLACPPTRGTPGRERIDGGTCGIPRPTDPSEASVHGGPGGLLLLLVILDPFPGLGQVSGL
jgi:hypothetical protein